jgi:hypothetical protein
MRNLKPRRIKSGVRTIGNMHSKSIGSKKPKLGPKQAIKLHDGTTIYAYPVLKD